ncbi:MAG: outer membrane lipoprotein chaperone LolA [Sinobacteraceae bacterium]|nr:outer membrane lipoprotein chaperone LolA [Nevskiaceae bacterium]
MSMPIRLVLAAALLSAGSVAVAAPSPTPAPASTATPSANPAPALQHFINHVSTFSADFEQTQMDGNGRIIKQQSGQVWLQRAGSAQDNGRFRWAYEKPYKQLIVCDGRRIWVYDPDLQQVTVRPAEQVLAGSPAALLAQRTTLSDAFVVAGATMSKGERVVRLEPRDKQSDFKTVVLSLKKGVPTRMLFRDQLGDTTEVRFSHIHTNRKIAAERFQFKPPKGVTVVGPNNGDSGG